MSRSACDHCGCPSASFLENQLQRLAWVRSSYVRKVLAVDLDGDSPYVVLEAIEPMVAMISPVLNCKPYSASFVGNRGSARNWPERWADRLASIWMGWPRPMPIGWNRAVEAFESGRWRIILTVSLRSRRVDCDGCCDCLSDVGSWGLFLKTLLEARSAQAQSLPASLLDVVTKLCSPDVEERATLHDLLGCFPDIAIAPRCWTARRTSISLRIAAVMARWPSEVAPALPGTSTQLTLHSRLGRFTIEQKLGEGGMGAVYKARGHCRQPIGGH